MAKGPAARFSFGDAVSMDPKSNLSHRYMTHDKNRRNQELPLNGHHH